MDGHPLTREGRARSVGPQARRSAGPLHLDGNGGQKSRNSAGAGWTEGAGWTARPGWTEGTGWTARPGFGAVLSAYGRIVRSAAQEKGSDGRTEQRTGRAVQNRISRTLVVDCASRRARHTARPDRRDTGRQASGPAQRHGPRRSPEACSDATHISSGPARPALRGPGDPRNDTGHVAGRSRAPGSSRGRSSGRGG